MGVSDQYLYGDQANESPRHHEFTRLRVVPVLL